MRFRARDLRWCRRAARAGVVMGVVLASVIPAVAADPLAEARRQYNLGNYVEAERYAMEALMSPDPGDGARVVLGRVQLERYRQTADPADFASARDALRAVDPRALDTRERVELLIGFAEALYLDDQFGAAADLFESVLQRSPILGAAAHERVLDWWATALDRQAQRLPAERRRALYDRVLSRMGAEIAEYPGSTAAGYWLAAARRASGDAEEAWHAALAGWVRAVLAEDRGAALRADLDRLVLQAIIPERAARTSPHGDAKQVETVMVSEWEAFKSSWSR